MRQIDRGGLPDPMRQLDASEAALAAKLGISEAPYIPPTENFYLSNYIFDGCVAANLRTGYGYYRSAAKQLLSFRRTQRPDGMVPGVSHPPQRFTVNPERWLSTRPFEGNDYTQTPDWARAVLRLCKAADSKPPVSAEQAINPDTFLKEIYPDLLRYYLYFIKKRQIADDDPRAFTLHPHEPNRDSAPEYDLWKQEELERQLGRLAIWLERRPRLGDQMPLHFNHLNRIRDYAGALAINLAGYKAGWEPARIHQTTEFIDVWFNCFLYENYHAMAELSFRAGYDEEAVMFGELALDLEQRIIKEHYFKNARDGQGAFYSTYNGAPMYRDTIGNLMTFFLKKLPPNQLQSNLELVRTGFNTPYILPSVATDDIANYDPRYEEEDRHWRGPAWIVANRMVMDGLDNQMDRGEYIPEALRNQCWELFHDIHSSNLAMVELTGDYAEHNNPINGQGQRMDRTRGHVFGVAAHMPI